jgi:GrpB-like predicted nucleotidyltransferase (UPF0157 family)
VSDEVELLVLNGDSPGVRRSFLLVAADLSAILPGAEIEHVGATAVAGCLTKGDIDVLVRVLPPDFSAASRALDDKLRRSERNESCGDYVEYDYKREGCAASIQLVAAGGWHDHRFRQLKRVLVSDDAALARYNELKRSHEGSSMTDYRAAKSAFIDHLLSHADAPVGSPDESVVPGIGE